MSAAGSSGGSSIGRAAVTAVRTWIPYVGVVAAFFLAVAILGAAVGHERRSTVVPLRSAGDPLPVLEPLDLFLHNSQVAGLMIVGVLFFALPTVALLAYNAFLFGASTASAVGSFGPLATATILLPHGIFELPALWLAGAIALRWIHVAWQTTRESERSTPAGRLLVESIVALVVVLCLLGAAAVIEGTITKDLASALT